jgi:transposase-like protein
LTPQQAPAAVFQTDTPAGFIHIDVKYLPPLGRRRSYAYVAIDRATRFVYLEILPDRRAATAAAFLDRFLDRFPFEVHTILTDNGSEFTDRFAVDKKAKPQDRPSGDHLFDRVCAARAITHRLAHDEVEVAALQPRQCLGEQGHALPPGAWHAGDVGAQNMRSGPNASKQRCRCGCRLRKGYSSSA